MTMAESEKDISISDIIIKNTSTPLLYQIVTHFQPNHNRTKVKRTEKRAGGCNYVQSEVKLVPEL